MNTLTRLPRAGAVPTTGEAGGGENRASVARRLRARPKAVVAGGLGVVTLVALAARLWLVDAQSGWLDEGYTMGVVRHTLGQVMVQTTQFDTHPPLYYLLLHLWLQVWGYGLVQGRLLSLLCGVTAVLLLFAVARALFDRATALYASALLAISPIAIWYSDEMRMYALAGLFVLGAFASLAWALRRDRPILWLSYACCAAAAVYTDYSAVYALAGAALSSLIVVLPQRQARRRWLTAHLGAGVLALPLVPTFVHQARDNIGQVAWIPMPTPAIVESTLLDLLSQNTGPRVALEALGAGLVTLGLVALYRDWRCPRVRRGYLFAAAIGVSPLALPLLASLSHPIFLTRTAMLALYGLLILIARGLTLPLRWPRLPRPWPLLALLLVTPVLVVNGRSLHAVATTTINEDWRGAAGYLRGQVLAGDVLIFDPEYLQLPLDLYWQHPPVDTVQRGYDRDEGLLTQPPRTLRKEADMAQAVTRAREVWLVTRESEPAVGVVPGDVVGRWLSRHMVTVGYQHVHGVSIRRFTRLPVAGDAEANAWLDAAGIVSRAATARDLVVVHGAGADAMRQAWRAYPHAPAPLVSLGQTGGRDALTAAIRTWTRTIWVVTAVNGYGDPAGVAGDWLYQHGRVTGPVYRFGTIRVYTFAHATG